MIVKLLESVFRQKNIFWFQPLKFEALLLFFVTSLGFGLLIEQKKQYQDVILDFGFSEFFCIIMKGAFFVLRDFYSLLYLLVVSPPGLLRKPC